MSGGSYRASEVTREAYHDDTFDDGPHLSASIASILCAATPLHAWAAHPLLNTAWAPRWEQKFDIGTAAHALLLEGTDVAVQVDADSWRTKAAQEARDAARAQGLVPLLAKDWARVQDMVFTARQRLDAHGVDPVPLTAGAAETTLRWEEDNGVVCKARCDWLRFDLAALDDLKTTSHSANPDAWGRATMVTIGADVQAAFYRRGVQAVMGGDPVFRWVVVETSPPYAVAVISPSPAALALGEAKVEFALRTWAQCLAADHWPGYTQGVAYADPPPWAEARWLEREWVAQGGSEDVAGEPQAATTAHPFQGEAVSQPGAEARAEAGSPAANPDEEVPF